MKNKTICLCMIVKNESHIILETLNNVKKHLDYWVICDTGSTDNTVELIQNFFDNEGIKGEIHSVEWKDFGHNRSQVFELAYKKADYLWVIDADDIVVGELNLNNLDADSYSLRYGNDFTYWRSQLFKGDQKWIYRGVVHEFPFCLSKETPEKKLIEGDYYVESRRLGARNLMDPKIKYLKDAKVLEEALQVENDLNLVNRYLFYIAQSYADAKELELAIEWYQKRIDVGGWDEEVWYSKFQIARLYECLGDYNKAEESYLDAFKIRPSRAESLHALGRMCNNRKEYIKAYSYLDYASQIPYPEKDVLFVFKNVYNYEIMFELSISAYWIGRFVQSLELCDKLISMKEKISPIFYEQTLTNRTFSVAQLAEKTNLEMALSSSFRL